MGKTALTIALILSLGSSIPAVAQSRAEASVYLDSLNVSQTNTNELGLGGRFGYRVHSHVLLEGELTYSFGVNFHEAYRNVVNGSLTQIEQTSIGVTYGLFGPTVEPAHGHLRPFATLKGGFLDFRLSPSLLPYSSEVSSLLGIRTSTLNGALYPGGGAQAVFGPVGLRLEFGDVIYFNRGAQNNLRISFGPVIRF